LPPGEPFTEAHVVGTGNRMRAKIVAVFVAVGAVLGVPAAIAGISGYSVKDLVAFRAHGASGPSAPPSRSPAASVGASVPASAGPSAAASPAISLPSPAVSVRLPGSGKKPGNTAAPQYVPADPPAAVTGKILSPASGTATAATSTAVRVRRPAPPAGRVWYLIVRSSRHTTGQFFYRIQDGGAAETTLTVGIGPAGEPGVATYTLSLATLTTADADAMGAYGDDKPMPAGTSTVDSVDVMRTA
jgi:hypothetical protein